MPAPEIAPKKNRHVDVEVEVEVEVELQVELQVAVEIVHVKILPHQKTDVKFSRQKYYPMRKPT